MKKLLDFATALVISLILFAFTTHTVAIDGASHAIARAAPESRPVVEPEAARPPPEIVPGIKEPKSQPIDALPEQKPDESPGSRIGIIGLLKAKLLYPIRYAFISTTRPKGGISGIMLNKVTNRVEVIVTWTDMPPIWEAGRGELSDRVTNLVSDPTKDVIINIPVARDSQRYSNRNEALDRLKKDLKHFESTDRSKVVGATVFKARTKDAIRYSQYLAKAEVQARRQGRDMAIVRAGMPQSEAATYKPYGRSILAPQGPGSEKALYINGGFQKGQYVVEGEGEQTERHIKFVGVLSPEMNWIPHDRPHSPENIAPDADPEKRGVNLDTLFDDSSNSNSRDNTLASQAAQFALFYSAFQAVQRNISSLIFPFLETMVNNSNATIVYHAAFSIWSDLTLSDYILVSPFCQGLNRFAEIEDDYAKANNLSTTSEEYQNMLAFNGILIAKYETAWNDALQAVNASGLLDLRDKLADNLQVNGTGIESPEFTTLKTDMGGIDWFLQYDIPANVSTNLTGGV